MVASQAKTKMEHPVSGQSPGRETSESVEIRAKDVMTATVSSVTSGMTVHDLAVFLDENKISAAPVIDDDQLVGIVSASDLLQREELGTSPSVANDQRLGSNFDLQKYHGRHVRDVMSPNVMTIGRDTGLDDVCQLMLDANVRHLLVEDEKNIVGMVSRSDIVHTLAARPEAAGPPKSYDDDIIRYRIMDVLVGFPGAMPWFTTVDVLNGVVTLNGSVNAETDLKVSARAIGDLENVRRVEDHRSIIQPY